MHDPETASDRARPPPMVEQRPPKARVSSPVAPRPPHDSLVAALEAAARDDAPFVTLHTGARAESLGARAALEGARRYAVTLRRRGVGRGDRVALLLPTSLAFVEALLGTMLAGGVPVPLASPLTFGGVERYLRNLVSVVRDAGAAHLVTYPRIRDALANDDALRALVKDVLTADEVEAGTALEAPLPSVSSSDTAFLQYTSGTTGQPKGVVVSHRAAVANAFAIAHGLGIGPTDVGVSWLPMFHDMGLIGALLTALCRPYPLHVMPPERFVVKPAGWLRLLASVGGTLSPAPNFAYDLCTARASGLEDVRLDRWRVALNGSEPVQAPTLARFADKFAPNGFRAEAMTPVYGMAEATLAVTFSRAGEGPSILPADRLALERDGRAVRSHAPDARAAISVGEPVAGTSIAITDDAGRELDEGVVGEVRVAGASLMDGYFRNEAASAAALVDGWLRTGDLGFVAGGRLYIVGRAKDLVIKAGRNLAPHDVERIVGELPGVRLGGVAAFGRTNETSGTDDLVVVAETSEAGEAERDAIVRAIRGEVLAALGVGVDEVRLWPPGAVPRTTSGKIRRRECARLAAEQGPP